MASQMVLVVENPPESPGDAANLGSSLGSKDPLEEKMAAHSTILAWEILWTEDLGGLQSMGSQEPDAQTHICTCALSLSLSLSHTHTHSNHLVAHQKLI